MTKFMKSFDANSYGDFCDTVFRFLTPLLPTSDACLHSSPLPRRPTRVAMFRELSPWEKIEGSNSACLFFSNGRTLNVELRVLFVLDKLFNRSKWRFVTNEKDGRTQVASITLSFH